MLPVVHVSVDRAGISLAIKFSSRSTPPSLLQLAVMPTFIQFMRKLFKTTLVSQSVIVLSLSPTAIHGPLCANINAIRFVWVGLPAAIIHNPILIPSFLACNIHNITTNTDAPFANASPPDVPFYPTPLPKLYSIYPPINWSGQCRHYPEATQIKVYLYY